jgi:hypothetical protein
MLLPNTSLRTPDWTDLVVAIAVGLLFVGSFRANQYLDGLMIYAPGVSLIFVPAGVKLLCLLVGGVPALAGILVSGVYLSLTLWTAQAVGFSLLIATIGVSSYSLAVWGIMRRFKIDPSLSNLNYWHILLLSACAGFLNGLGVNLAYFNSNITGLDELLRNVLAMAYGDFLGCFIVVMLFQSVVLLFRKVRANGVRSE